MKVRQLQWIENQGWHPQNVEKLVEASQLVLVFGNREVLVSSNYHATLSQFFPSAQIISCSTSGDILNNRILSQSLTANALFFEKTGRVALEFNDPFHFF